MRIVELAIVWLAFLVICFAAAFHRGFDAQLAYDPGSPPDNQFLALQATTAETTARYGGGAAGRYRGGDLASYLAAGERILEAGDFEYAYAELWPPGMAIIIAALLATTGTGAYPLKMVLISVLAWSLALLFAYRLLRPSAPRLIAFALPASLWLLPNLRDWTFGFGAVMSESLSHACFVIGACILVGAFRTNEMRTFAIGGAMIGLATIIRAYFDYVGNVVLGGAAFLLCAALFISVLRRIARRFSARELMRELRQQLFPREGRRTGLAALATCWLAAFVACTAVSIPWRLYKTVRWKQASLVSTPPGYTFTYSWMPDEKQPAFFKGANAACKTDPQLCEVIQKESEALGPKLRQKLALMTFFFRPHKWIAIKLSLVDWLWFGRDFASARREPWIALEGFILLACGLFGAYWLVRAARRASSELRDRRLELYQLAWLSGAFAFWNAVFFTFLQYEWRYSLAARLFCFLLPLFVFSVVRRRAA